MCAVPLKYTTRPASLRVVVVIAYAYTVCLLVCVCVCLLYDSAVLFTPILQSCFLALTQRSACAGPFKMAPSREDGHTLSKTRCDDAYGIFLYGDDDDDDNDDE